MNFVRKITRSHIGARIIAWFFSHLHSLIPMKRLHETELIMAIKHPAASYPVHCLILPKKQIRNLSEITMDDGKFLLDVLKSPHIIAPKTNLRTDQLSLIVNGGSYQDVPQLHFHLINAQTWLNEQQ